MARRGRPQRGRRRKPRVYWDQSQVSGPEGVLPAVSGTDLSTVGRQTSIRRYTSSADVMWEMMRTQVILSGVWTDGATPMTLSGGVMICLGWTFGDDPRASDGQSNNVLLGPGTGPLSDADNSRWFARCCFHIPLGFLLLTGADLCPQPASLGMGRQAHGYCAEGGEPGVVNWTAWCELQSKSRRKLQGLETDWLQFCLEARTYDIAGSLGTWNVVCDFYESRWLLSLRV